MYVCNPFLVMVGFSRLSGGLGIWYVVLLLLGPGRLGEGRGGKDGDFLLCVLVGCVWLFDWMDGSL